MDFTPRTQQILEILLGGKGPVSKQEIADRLGVSKRTIQREFGFLESDIRRYGLQLVNRKGKGIVLSSLIRKYRHYQISSGVSFRELLRVMAMQVTDSLAAAAGVIDSVTERERLNSQIFPEMEFCLLHARTDAVSETVFVSCSPRDADRFTDPALKGIRAAVLLLMPVDDHRRIHADVLGRISSAFIRYEAFLQAVHAGTEDHVRTELTHELRTYFSEYVEKL